MSFHDKVNMPQKKDNNSSSPKQTRQISLENYQEIIQRVRRHPQTFSRADSAVLQSTIGNQAVGRLMKEIGIINDNSKPVQREALLGEEEVIQGKFDTTVQREEESLQMKKENKTGLPDNLKAGVENLSGLSMDDVKVHYNSDKPAHVGALAYTQGEDIHVAPGQEKHLPHEAWHVVQQVQGRVKPTMQLKGVQVNDDAGLEKEADKMGVKAIQMMSNENDINSLQCLKIDKNNIIQRMRHRGVASDKAQPESTSEREPTVKRDYERIDGISKGTKCYRFIILLHGVKPDIGHRELTDDNEGGVSLTLDPSKTPKGRPIKGRWKATYKLRNDMDLYICKGKQFFEAVLREDPERLCYTTVEAELKCKAKAFEKIFEFIRWEKHQPESQEDVLPTRTTSEAEPDETRFSHFNPDTGFLDTDYDALFNCRWNRREVEFVPADNVRELFSEEQAAKFINIGDGKVKDKYGNNWTVVHFDTTQRKYYLKVGW